MELYYKVIEKENDSKFNEIAVWNKVYTKCISHYNEQWIPKVQHIGNLIPNRQKRGLIGNILVGAGGFAIGASVSNLVATFFSWVNPNSDHNRLERLKHQKFIHDQLLKKFTENFNITSEIQHEIAENMKKMAIAISTHSKKIDLMTDLIPEVTWVSTYLQNKISIHSNLLAVIIDKYKHQEVPIRELAELLNMTQLLEHFEEEGRFLSLSMKGPNTINLKLMLREKSQDTRVYRVSAFTHWTKLTTDPHIIRYTGSEYAIFNKTCKCAKAIESPSQKAVFDECTEQNGSEKLKRWTREPPLKNVSGVYPISDIKRTASVIT